MPGTRFLLEHLATSWPTKLHDDVARSRRQHLLKLADRPNVWFMQKGTAANQVIDTTAREIVAELHVLNDACLEIQAQDGKIIRTGHDSGSGLDTWVEGFDTPPNR